MMRRSPKEIIIKGACIACIAAYCLHASSCASTKAAPTGGPKDTIPPVIVETVPSMDATSFPLEKGSITISFNEYIQIKDPNKNILLSPPQKKNVKTRIKGKGLIVTFQEPLDTNTTYSLNFGAGIVDNNEGNPLYGYSYSFSTGTTIDSMMLSGTVVDAVSLFPIEGATIALYRNARDSSVINTLPDAVARSDKWGYFTVRNLKPVPYSVFAFSDGNNNNRYDPGSEDVAFLDTLVTPVEVMHKDSPHLQYVDPKDTLACLARHSEIELFLFSEKSTNQFIRDYKRTSRRSAYIKFNASDAQIDSFSIKGIEGSRIIRQSNITNDSLNFWIKEGRTLPDTLELAIRYMKTDTSGNLSPAVENLKLVAPFEKKEDRKGSQSSKDGKRKDLLEFTLDSDPAKVEQDGIVMLFKDPLISMDLDSVTFRMRTPKRIESDVVYNVTRDSIEINKYSIRPEVQFVKGNDYELYIPHAAFKDINGFTNDSTVVNITLPTDDNLSSITLELRDVGTRYIVELINAARTQVYRKYVIQQDTDLIFPYLQKGDYSIRITEDKNSNGIFDTGDLLLKKQPEKVRLYTLPDGNEIMSLEERTDLVQSVVLGEIFGN
ncbi:MAG: Ig-like domain-containing protein [Bacteroidales bacterium]|nr:Ig-like domain-containing protein [Bacteroidales bacterium]